MASFHLVKMPPYAWPVLWRSPTLNQTFRPQMNSASVISFERRLYSRALTCLNFPTMYMVLLIFFLIHYTSANDFEITRPRDQGYSFANTAVESFLIDDSELTGPSRGDQPVLIFSDASSESNPSSRDQTWIEDIESLFMVGKPGTHCTNEKAETSLDQLLPPSRFQRRSSSSSSSSSTTTPAQLSNRGESKPSCISPETANEHELENADPGKPPEGKPDPPNRDKTPPIVSEMILRVRMYGSISHEPHEKGCGDLLVPICAPFPPERQYPRIDKSPSELVVPARFWFLPDPCFTLIEDLWCCDTAKAPNWAIIPGIMPRYPGVGFNCQIVIERGLQN